MKLQKILVYFVISPQNKDHVDVEFRKAVFPPTAKITYNNEQLQTNEKDFCFCNIEENYELYLFPNKKKT